MSSQFSIKNEPLFKKPIEKRDSCQTSTVTVTRHSSLKLIALVSFSLRDDTPTFRYVHTSSTVLHIPVHTVPRNDVGSLRRYMENSSTYAQLIPKENLIVLSYLFLSLCFLLASLASAEIQDLSVSGYQYRADVSRVVCCMYFVVGRIFLCEKN